MQWFAELQSELEAINREESEFLLGIRGQIWNQNVPQQGKDLKKQEKRLREEQKRREKEEQKRLEKERKLREKEEQELREKEEQELRRNSKYGAMNRGSSQSPRTPGEEDPVRRLVATNSCGGANWGAQTTDTGSRHKKEGSSRRRSSSIRRNRKGG